jgi:IS30 family transposase
MYTQHKNSRLTTGDIKLLEAYSQQGVSVNQIAKALNVHRSTIFRKLKKVDISKVKNKP